MIRSLVIPALTLALLAGCDRTPPLQRELNLLQKGDSFPAGALPAELKDKQWKLAGSVLAATSDHPVQPGGKRCVAPMFILHSEAAPALLAVAYVFCGDQQLTGPDGAPGLHWALPGDSKTQYRFDTYFAPALGPNEDLFWVTERTRDPRKALTIRERAWRSRGGKLEQVLDLVGADPAIYAPNADAATIERRARFVATSYASGFIGATFPKVFHVTTAGDRRWLRFDYEYSENAGYHPPLQIPLPGAAAAVDDVIDGGM